MLYKIENERLDCNLDLVEHKVAIYGEGKKERRRKGKEKEIKRRRKGREKLAPSHFFTLSKAVLGL